MVESFANYNFDYGKFTVTLMSLGLIISLRFIFKKMIYRSKVLPSNIKRRYQLNVISILWFLFVLGLIFIWATELRMMALSLVAFAVATVIATKEMILCGIGGIYRTTNNLFNVGDRIEINDIRGDVIDRTLFSTTLMEIGPKNVTHQYTGRAVVVPNALFLSHQLINESFLKNFVLHTFFIPIPISADWKKAEEILLRVSSELCEPFLGPAKRYLSKVEAKTGIESPNPAPRVHINVESYKQYQLVVRITVPAQQRGKIEQEIVKKFLSEFSFSVM
jgi:small-conductance mechanosensitive channel